MKASDIPTKIAVPWADNATSSYVRNIPVTTPDPVAASFSLGWPPDTGTPTEAGGTPPDIRDANGIERLITRWLRWGNAGGPLTFDQSFSDAVGGYPAGAFLKSTSGFGKFWISTADDNTTNPDGMSAANWQEFPNLSKVVYYIDTAVTKTVYGAGADFADLNAAFEWLRKFIITPAGSVTFNLASGQFSHSSIQNISHPNWSRIFIMGAALNIGAPTQGNFAINGSSSGARAADAATNLAMLRSRFTTELQFNVGSGIAVIGNGIGLLKNVLLTGGNIGTGISVADGASVTIDTVAVYGFNGNWFVTDNSSVTGPNLYSCNSASNGISAALSGSINVLSGALVGCQSGGSCVSVTDSGTLVAQNSVAEKFGGATSHAVSVWKSGNVWLPDLIVVYCGGNGVRCADSASAKIDGGTGSNCAGGLIYAIYGASITAGNFTTNNETPADFTAVSGSFIYAVGYTSPGATFSPAKNTVGNGNSYIEA